MLSEELDRISFRPANDYAISKWVNELQAFNYEKNFGSPIVRVRLFNAYGPGEYYSIYRSVVCLFCYRSLMDIPYCVHKKCRRTFMYIDDLIPTLANICDNFKPGEVYNIGGTDNRSIEDLHIVLSGILGYVPKFELVEEEEHNRKDKIPSIERAKKDLGHNPRIFLEEGLVNTLNWYRETYL